MASSVSGSSSGGGGSGDGGSPPPGDIFGHNNKDLDGKVRYVEQVVAELERAGDRLERLIAESRSIHRRFQEGLAPFGIDVDPLNGIPNTLNKLQAINIARRQEVRRLQVLLDL